MEIMSFLSAWMEDIKPKLGGLRCVKKGYMRFQGDQQEYCLGKDCRLCWSWGSKPSTFTFCHKRLDLTLVFLKLSIAHFWFESPGILCAQKILILICQEEKKTWIAHFCDKEDRKFSSFTSQVLQSSNKRCILSVSWCFYICLASDTSFRFVYLCVQWLFQVVAFNKHGFSVQFYVSEQTVCMGWLTLEILKVIICPFEIKSPAQFRPLWNHIFHIILLLFNFNWWLYCTKSEGAEL